MEDVDGPMIARHLYGALFQGNEKTQLDSDDVAYALDSAVEQLRRKHSEPIRWACYVHIGM
jgi:hypothetical protein